MPDNIEPAVIKPSRCEPVLNESRKEYLANAEERLVLAHKHCVETVPPAPGPATSTENGSDSDRSFRRAHRPASVHARPAAIDSDTAPVPDRCTVRFHR